MWEFKGVYYTHFKSIQIATQDERLNLEFELPFVLAD